jgi:hypothetical protein
MRSLKSYEYAISGCVGFVYKEVRTECNKKIEAAHVKYPHFIAVHSPCARVYGIQKSAVEVSGDSQVQLGITAQELRNYGV